MLTFIRPTAFLSFPSLHPNALAVPEAANRALPEDQPDHSPLFAELQIGKALVRREGKDVALLGYGTMVNDCLEAAKMLEEKGISAEVVDMRFCKPLDTELVERVAKDYPVVITVEENSIGGFGSHGMHRLSAR